MAEVALCALAVALAVWLAMSGRADGKRRLAVSPNDTDGSRHQIDDAALAADLVAAALSGGLGIASALTAVAAAGSHDGRSPREWSAMDQVAGLASGVAPGARPLPAAYLSIADAVTFAASTGAPIVPLLTQAAATARRRRRDGATKAAGQLAASLVLPLGLCALPGFLLLGVAPVVLRLVLSLS